MWGTLGGGLVTSVTSVTRVTRAANKDKSKGYSTESRIRKVLAALARASK